MCATYQLRDPAEHVEDAEHGHEPGELDLLLRLHARLVAQAVRRAGGRVALADAQVVPVERAAHVRARVVRVHARLLLLLGRAPVLRGVHGRPVARAAVDRQQARPRLHGVGRGRVAREPARLAAPVHLVEGLDHAQVARHDHRAHGETLTAIGHSSFIRL